MRRAPVLSSLLVAVAAFLGAARTAETAASFYEGKRITLLIANGAGGGYDAYARAFARHASRHIPGHPAILPKNMPGAGGLAAADNLFNSAERDGLTIAAFTNGAAMDPLFGNPSARFDPLKLNWLGSIGKLENVCATWHTSAIRTIADARKREVVVAAAGATSNTAIMPKIINALLGTRFKVVGGYEEGSGLTMAVENGEVEGICGLSWSTMKASRPQWIRDHRLNVLLQMSLQKVPDLPGVPSALDLVTDSDAKKILELILIRQEMGRPFVAPPDVPRDRIAALRRAFDQTMRDPAFLAEAQKAQMEIAPLTGDEIETLLKKAYATPKPIVARAADLAEPGHGKVE